jgi:hypothetical protein
MSDLYDIDTAQWSEQQAALLRRMGGGERVNDQVDWQNVAEEIESLARSERHALRDRPSLRGNLPVAIDEELNTSHRRVAAGVRAACAFW